MGGTAGANKPTFHLSEFQRRENSLHRSRKAMVLHKCSRNLWKQNWKHPREMLIFANSGRKVRECGCWFCVKVVLPVTRARNDDAEPEFRVTATHTRTQQQAKHRHCGENTAHDQKGENGENEANRLLRPQGCPIFQTCR